VLGTVDDGLRALDELARALHRVARGVDGGLDAVAHRLVGVLGVLQGVSQKEKAASREGERRRDSRLIRCFWRSPNLLGRNDLVNRVDGLDS
jgi:hypothetical protein